MPKNKRAKVVALTQTQKKGRERKVALAGAVRDCTDKFSHAYVMQTVNMKTTFMQTIRQDWKERGVFIHGKLKVLSLGVGISASTEPKPNMHKLAEHIGPDCLLFFTNEGPKVVAKYCEEWGESDHARSGFECTSTYVLPKGHLPQFTFTQDEMLRKLGVPVCLRASLAVSPPHILPGSSARRQHPVGPRPHHRNGGTEVNPRASARVALDGYQNGRIAHLAKVCLVQRQVQGVLKYKPSVQRSISDFVLPSRYIGSLWHRCRCK